MAETVRVNIEADTAQAQKNVNDLGGSINETGNLTENLTNQIDSMTGGLVSSFRGIKTGLKSAITGFKGLKGAIAATGIGALIIGITAAVEWFTKFDAGVKIVNQTLDALAGGITQLATAFNLLLQGDFGGAADAFTGIANAAKDAWQQSAELFEVTKQLKELQAENIPINAKLRQELELQKKILEDTTLTEKERLEALEQVTALSSEIQKNAIEENKLKKEELELKIALVDNDEERRDLQIELGQVTAELIDQEGQLAIIRKDAEKVEREIIAQTQAKRNEQLAEEVRLQKELRELLKVDEEQVTDEGLDALDAQFMKEFEVEEKWRQKSAEANEFWAAKDAEIFKQYQEEEAKAEEEALRRKEAVAKAKMQIDQAINNSLLAASQLLGETTAAGKAFAIAQLLFSQGAALGKALSNSQSPTPDNLASGGLAGIAKFATIASSILTTAVQARKIINSAPQIPSVGGGGGGSSFGGGGGGASFSNFTQANTPTISSIPTFNNTPLPTNEQRNVPVRAFVVENDITTAQNSQKALERRAIL